MSSGAARFPLSRPDEQLPALIHLSAIGHHLQLGIDLLSFCHLLMSPYVPVTLRLLPPPFCLQITLPSLLNLTAVGVSYQGNSLFL